MNRNALLLPEATKVDVAFVFMGTSVPEYATVEAAMIKMLGKISSSLAALSDKNCGENTPDSSKETAS